MEPAPAAAAADDDEERQARLTAALLGSVALVEIGGALARGPHGPIDFAFHAVVALPAAGFAIALWRGLRPRIGIVVFALLWSVLSIWAAVTARKIMSETFADPMPFADPRVSLQAVSTWLSWLLRVIVARAACFTAAVIVLVTGRPRRARRRLGAAIGAGFALLFVAEQVYQMVGVG